MISHIGSSACYVITLCFIPAQVWGGSLMNFSRDDHTYWWLWMLQSHHASYPSDTGAAAKLFEWWPPWKKYQISQVSAFWAFILGWCIMEITRRKKYSVTHWVISLRMMKVLLTHRVTSPWVPLQLVPLVLYCSPAFEQKYHLYGFHSQGHDHHCRDCIQHHHLLHISPPLSLSPTHVLLLPESSPSLAPD